MANTTGQQLVNDIKSFFVRITDKDRNYWGVANYGNTLVSFACLHCGKCRPDFDDFIDYGIRYGENVYFCDSCSVIYSRKLIQLQKYETPNETLYKLATQGINEHLVMLQNIFKDEIEEAKSQKKRWMFFKKGDIK